MSSKIDLRAYLKSLLGVAFLDVDPDKVPKVCNNYSQARPTVPKRGLELSWQPYTV